MKNFMKISALSSAIALAFLAVSCGPKSAPVSETDLEKYELKGPVASVRSTSYKVDSTAKKPYKVAEVEASSNNVYVEFNDFGMATRLERFNRAGKVVSIQESEYNENGQITRSCINNPEGDVMETTVYKYKRGRLAEMTTTDAQDSLKKHEVYKYYDRDSVVATFSYKEDKTAGRRVSKYDENGYNYATVTYSNKDKVLSEFLMEHDEAGRNVAINSENVFFGKLDSEIKYNEDGFRSEMLMKGKTAETVFRFEYELDANGNWTKKITYKDDAERPIRIEMRKIEYR